MTKGHEKLIEIMKKEGYIKVAERVGISKSLIVQYRSGSRDTKKMGLLTAYRFKKHYNIGFMEWFERWDL